MNPRGAVVPTLYQRVLGTRFGDLHPVLRRFHSSEVRIAGRGLFRVVYHPGWFRMVLLFASPFPPAGEGVEVASEVSPTGAGERWVRSFAGRPLVTWQTHRGDLLLERSGPPCLGLVLDVVAGGLTFRTRRVWMLGIPLPQWMAPLVEAQALPAGELWNIAVRVTLPLDAVSSPVRRRITGRMPERCARRSFRLRVVGPTRSERNRVRSTAPGFPARGG